MTLLVLLSNVEAAVWAAFYVQFIGERKFTADPDAAAEAAAALADREVIRLRAVTRRRAELIVEGTDGEIGL